MENLLLEIPKEHQEEFIDLLCLGGNYKEYVDDPDEPGEMIPNPVLKLDYAQAQIEIIVFQYVQGQNHRKKETVLRKAQQELAKEETSFDTFLKKEKK